MIEIYKISNYLDLSLYIKYRYKDEIVRVNNTFLQINPSWLTFKVTNERLRSKVCRLTQVCDLFKVTNERLRSKVCRLTQVCDLFKVTNERLTSKHCFHARMFS